MSTWIVIEYDRVDIRRFQDSESRYVPGAPTTAHIAEADSEEKAILAAADGDGFFAATPLPNLTPRRVTVERWIDDDSRGPRVDLNEGSIDG